MGSKRALGSFSVGCGRTPDATALRTGGRQGPACLGTCNPQLAHFAEQGGAFESQPLGSAAWISKHPLRFAQGSYDSVTFGFGEGPSLTRDSRGGLLQFRERSLKGRAGGQNRGALDEILQFTHITGQNSRCR